MRGLFNSKIINIKYRDNCFVIIFWQIKNLSKNKT
jgi:hypothetical protein